MILVEVPAISFGGGLHPCTNTKADTLLAYVRYMLTKAMLKQCLQIDIILVFFFLGDLATS